MSNFGDVLESANFGLKKNSKFIDKETWARERQKERKEAFLLIDTMAMKITKNEEDLKKYLGVQSCFDKYSVGNALLITAQRPTAVQLKESDKWREIEGFVKEQEQENGIIILEPVEYINGVGEKATTYQPKKVFDISQTNIAHKERKSDYDDKVILKALTYKCYDKIEVVDELRNGIGAEWDKENNVLYIAKGIESPKIFHEIAREIARINFADMPKSELEEFKCNSVSYMVCKKLGIDVSEYKLDLPKRLSDMDAKSIRNELTTIHVAMEDVDLHVRKYFEDLSKVKRNKEQER